MSDERVVATLKHPRTLSGFSGSPFSAPPPFQQPLPLCSFSTDDNRERWHDDRSKRYYRGPPPYNNPHPIYRNNPPALGADLNYGLERFIERDENLAEHLDGLVAALQHRTESASTEAERDELDAERKRADVVTWRGIITKICTAYDQTTETRFPDTLDLNAMLLDGTLYLEEYTPPAVKAEKERQHNDPMLHKFTYYGYAFESYCTVDTEAEVKSPFHPTPRRGSNTPHPPGWSGGVNNNVQWCQVVKTKLGNNRLIIGGEVDAVQRNAFTDKEELVELKTSMRIRNKNGAGAQEKFEKKLLKFFLQSFLLGIGKVVVGFRDHHGFLTTHQEFETLRIPRMVRAGQPIPGKADRYGNPVVRDQSVWDPKNSLGFGDRILSFIRKTISEHMASSPEDNVDLNNTNSGSVAADGKPKDVPDAISSKDIDAAREQTNSNTKQADTHSKVDSNSNPTPNEAKIHHPVYRITYKPPFTQVEIRPLTKEEIFEQVQDGGTSGERVGFLPRSFYDFVQSRIMSPPPS